MKKAYIQPTMKASFIDPKEICEAIAMSDGLEISDMQGKKYDIDVWDEDEEEE